MEGANLGVKMITIVLSPSIKNVEKFMWFLEAKNIHAFIGNRDYNTVNGEKVKTNKNRKLINELYGEFVK